MSYKNLRKPSKELIIQKHMSLYDLKNYILEHSFKRIELLSRINECEKYLETNSEYVAEFREFIARMFVYQFLVHNDDRFDPHTLTRYFPEYTKYVEYEKLTINGMHENLTFNAGWKNGSGCNIL